MIRRSESIAAVSGGLVLAGVLACALGLIFSQLLAPRAEGEARDILRAAGGVIVLAGFSCSTLGLGLTVFAPLRLGAAAAALGFGSHRVMLIATAFSTLLAALLGNLVPLAFAIGIGSPAGRGLTIFLSAALSVSLVLLAVAYLRFIRPGVVGWSSFGFLRNRLAPNQAWVWPMHLISGCGGGVIVVLISGAIQLALRAAGVQQTQLNDYTWVPGLSPLAFSLVWLAGAVLAPFSEELFFRGLIFGSYYQVKGPTTAYLVSATVFSFLHLNLPALLPILVLGLLLGYLYRRTGSITPCVIAHACNNGLTLLVLYFAPGQLNLSG